jgi:hypothetical protein
MKIRARETKEGRREAGDTRGAPAILRATPPLHPSIIGCCSSFSN